MYKFSEKSMNPSLRTCVDKIMTTDKGGGGADRGRDRQTERGKEKPPPPTSFAGGIQNYKIKCYCDHCDHYLRNSQAYHF